MVDSDSRRKVTTSSAHCFPLGGREWLCFRYLKKALPEGIEVYSMMLPGRLSRKEEGFAESVDEIVENLVVSMEGLGLIHGSQPPTVFFGHSYGGIIAYELALLLEQQKMMTIAHMVISSTNCPEVLTARSQSNDVAFYKKFHLVKYIMPLLVHSTTHCNQRLFCFLFSFPILTWKGSLSPRVHSKVVYT